MIRPAALRKYAGDIRGAARFGFSNVTHVTCPIDCFEDDLAPLVARLLEDEANRMERGAPPPAADGKEYRWRSGPSPLNEHDEAVERAAARQARKISGAE